MESLYIACAVGGLILVIATIVLGDSDLDADTDIDMDPSIDFDADVDFNVDGAGELDALNTAEKKGKKNKKAYLPFLSLRFWIFGICVFGVTGSVLIRMNLGLTAHLTLASAMGLLVGWFAALLFHQLQNTTTDSSASMHELAGREATVVLPIRPSSTGKVRVRIKEQDLEITATSSHSDVLEIDQRVRIVSSSNGQVTVIPSSKVN